MTTTKTPPTGRAIAIKALRLALRTGGHLFDLWTKTGKRVKAQCEGTPAKTATWQFDATSRTERHIVTLDPEFPTFVNVTGVRVRSTASLLRLGTAMIRHEKWHGLITERDIARVAAHAKAKGVPFTALNIGEDVRIEARAVADEKQGFDWTTWYALTFTKTDEPLAWLFSAKHHGTEHPPVSWDGARKAERIVGGKADGKGERKAVDILREFYADIVAAASTYVVADILADLFATFPTATKDSDKIPELPDFAGVGYSDKAGSALNPVVDTVYGGDYTKVEDSTLPRNVREALDHFAGEYHKPSDWRLPIAQFAEEQAKRGASLPDLTGAADVANRLAQMLGSVDSPRQQTSTSGSRLHMPNVMVGDSSAFRQPTKRGGKRRIVAVFDQSGSMRGDWYRHGAKFAAALMLLHKRGIIDATIVMTGGRKHAIIPNHLPIETLAHLTACQGCESVASTLTSIAETLRQADTVMVYTDGNLTDGKVDAGHWRSLGVDLIGVAVMPRLHYMAAHCKVEMSKHFGKVIMAETAPRLATSIVQYIATKK